jgi:DNA transposition AAA+ family ATPase
MTEVVSIFNEPKPVFAKTYPRYCPTPTAKLIENTCLLCIQGGRMGLIVGGPGIGKTMALKRFKEQNGRTLMVTINRTHKSLRSVIALLCDELGSWAPPGLADAFRGVAQTAAMRDLQLLIVDEAHTLGDDVIDTLRSLYDETGIPILFCGNAEFRSRFNNERKGFGQVASRVGIRLSLKHPSLEDVDIVCDDRDIHDRSARALLFEKSQSAGGLRLMHDLINMAIKIAGNGKAVQVKHIKEGLLILMGGSQ